MFIKLFKQWSNIIRTSWELENIRKLQSELENIKTKMKNILEGINSRQDDTEKQIRSMEGRTVEITLSKRGGGGGRIF